MVQVAHAEGLVVGDLVDRTATAAPNRQKISDTVVEVGSPIEL